VNGLRADESAVAAALVEPWSNGQTEGQITKLKLVKRQMYGARETRSPPCTTARHPIAPCTEIESEPNCTPKPHQGAAAKEWLAEREAELLPVPYYHVVFTLPAPISDIAYQNKAAIVTSVSAAPGFTCQEWPSSRGVDWHMNRTRGHYVRWQAREISNACEIGVTSVGEPSS